MNGNFSEILYDFAARVEEQIPHTGKSLVDAMRSTAAFYALKPVMKEMPDFVPGMKRALKKSFDKIHADRAVRASQECFELPAQPPEKIVVVSGKSWWLAEREGEYFRLLDDALPTRKEDGPFSLPVRVAVEQVCDNHEWGTVTKTFLRDAEGFSVAEIFNGDRYAEAVAAAINLAYSTSGNCP